MFCSFFYIDEQSDDDSSASVAELGYSPDKEEGRTHTDVRDHEHHELPHRKDCLSPCHHVSERATSVPTCPDSENKKDEEQKKQKKSQRTSVRKKETITDKSIDSLESPSQGRTSDNSKNLQKERMQSQMKSPRLSPNKSEKRKQKITKVKLLEETKSLISPDTMESSSCLSSATRRDAPPGQKTPKRARQSFSAAVRSFTSSSDHKSVTPVKADGDDNVFEDYFSPANQGQRSERLLSLNLPVESSIQIPFKLDPVPKKRKQRRSEIFDTQGQKKRKLQDRQSETSNETSSQQVEESLALSNRPSAHKLMGQPPTLPEDKMELKKNSDFNVPCHTVESE